MDQIIIEELKIYANHGVFDFEKENGQNFYVSACCYLDLQKASLSDDLADTVSYADICDEIEEYTKNNTFDLIETLADRLCVHLLNKYSVISRIVLQVKKPEAPIDKEFENVSVKVSRMRHKAYIAFGSNLGDSESLIMDAKSLIDDEPHCKIVKESSVYRTTAYGVTDQPDFYNGVWEIETFLDPFNLLEFLHKVEHKGGRERKEHWGPRTIDLDIILYDDLVLDSEYLTIPHSDMANRDFVLEPLTEIAGYMRHPLTGKTIKEMCLDIKERHII